MHTLIKSTLFFALLVLASCAGETKQEQAPATATDTVKPIEQPWLVGCNFIPSTASNQLEMWQAETFDTATISKELGWAASIGMNTVRVFLHDLAYKTDPDGFLQRMNTFLEIAQRHGIKVLFVFFDSCWDPAPKAGKQSEPVARRHNSRWLQSPGKDGLRDGSLHPQLEVYVKAVVKRFKADDRILGWDVWNEPDNLNEGSYAKTELPGKVDYVLPLLKKAFVWVRAENPAQPLTCGIWMLYNNWSPEYKLSALEQVQVDGSDILTFHYYGNAEELEKRITWLQKWNKPLMCTEYLARSVGSTMETCLPVFKKHKVGAFNWGLVDGRTNTIYPWDSWDKKYTAEPDPWHHDIFRKDGTPYSQSEVQLMTQLTKQ